MVKTTGRNEPCPCGSGKKYKKCCMRNTMDSTPESLPESFMDDRGFHIFAKGEKPDSNQIKEMEAKYQTQVRNSPIWDDMVEQFGLEKAEELLKEFKVKIE